MHTRSRVMPWFVRFAALPLVLLGGFVAAQTRPAAPAPAPVAAAPAVSEKDLAAIQEELIRLLRLSPTLTTVVARDPSLLSNQDYVSRNNPQLAAFIAAHPEVGRNPEFYLFTHLPPGEGGPDHALERAVWPEMVRGQERRTGFDELLSDLPPVLGIACFLGVLAWLVRLFLENRRWTRIFHLQSEVHGRLIDKFSSNQELATYMGTEAGKRFLEAAPIPVGFQPEQRVPNAVARVLTPLQIGIVLSLLGAGFFLLRHASPEMEIPMLVLGTVSLMPGLGFIISAGVTWVLAARLGLMPDNPGETVKADFQGRQ